MENSQSFAPLVKQWNIRVRYIFRLIIKKCICADEEKIEIVAIANGKWIRITGKAVEDSSMEVRKEMLESHPFLQKQYNLDDGVFRIFYIDEMKAVLNGFGGEVEET